MAEIKSTLELVMEKTRDLTLSQQDREEQKNREITLKVEGLLQKYQNRELRKDHLEEEVNRLQKVYGKKVHALAFYESVKHINLEEDFSLLNDFLEEFFGVDLGGVKFLLKTYHKTIQNQTQKTTARLKKVLEEQHGLSGAAVLPNVEGDNAWQAAVDEIKCEFQAPLSEEKERLKKNLLALH